MGQLVPKTLTGDARKAAKASVVFGGLEAAQGLIGVGESMANANRLSREASAAIGAAAIEAESASERDIATISSGIAAVGGSGVRVTTGSPMMVAMRSFERAQRNVDNIIRSGGVRAKQALGRARAERIAGVSLLTSGLVRGIRTARTGIREATRLQGEIQESQQARTRLGTRPESVEIGG